MFLNHKLSEYFHSEILSERMFKNKRLIVSKISSNFREATEIIEEDVGHPGELVLLEQEINTPAHTEFTA